MQFKIYRAPDIGWETNSKGKADKVQGDKKLKFKLLGSRAGEGNLNFFFEFHLYFSIPFSRYK